MEHGAIRRHPTSSSDDTQRRGAAERPVARHRQPRKGLWFLLPPPPRQARVLYMGILCFAALLLGLGFWQLRWLNTGNGWPGWGEGGGGGPAERRLVGAKLWFVPSSDLLRRLEEGEAAMDRMRSGPRVGIRPPRLALVLGSMNRNPETLMLLTVVKSLQGLGYTFTVFALEEGEAHCVFALEEGEAHCLWQQIGYQVSVLGLENSSFIDWTNYEGVLASSLEVKSIISSLMQEPFYSVPLIWLVQEDVLGKHLPMYAATGWEDLTDNWRSTFHRADVVVFPDYSLPMLYTSLDSGNFYVISGSPVDAWAAKKYKTSHSQYQLRKDNGFSKDDLIILVIGSYFYYDELPWDYAAAMNALVPNILKTERLKALIGKFKFVFLCGNSTDAHASVFQDLASRMRFPGDSVRCSSSDGDVNSVILMADIVLYASFQEEQSFPPLLVRAMSFEIPIIVPDLSIIKKYVVDRVHGLIYHPSDPASLTKAFSLLIGSKNLSNLAHIVASYGKLLSSNMLASDCIVKYAKLLERVLQFPSDVLLPGSVSEIQQKSWLWDLLEKEVRQIGISIQHGNSTISDQAMHKSSAVYELEEQYYGSTHKGNTFGQEIGVIMQEFPTQLDWNEINEMEMSEDFERREMQEIEERTGKALGSWEDVYRNARNAEKQKFETNERDEGELERTGQPLCIYEIYNGEGSWPFLHHGSLYRGVSLSRRGRRLISDDVDAVGRLPILNDTYYNNLICELGAMFAIANRVDIIHKIPWIGFQSWRAAGKKISLSIKAEKVLEESIQETQGEVIYYWAVLDLQHKNKSVERNNFWYMCDILNGGHCRAIFANAFRQMYGLPHETEALPPMPADGDKWSALHSWVMPTPSFLEFIMFSRMFADSLDSIVQNTTNVTSCVLGSSRLEQRHCYCRILEILVNVWAYHSARKMVYLNPVSGELVEQHPIDQRKGLMLVKFFNLALLKDMDQDLAEEADDAVNPRDRWLWPLTGEVVWQGILDREREDKYRRKMDKKRKTKEKQLERQKHGYKQKSLGG